MNKILNFLKQNKYRIMLIIWMSIIFVLSSIPNLKSDIPGFSDVILRKGAHFVEYFILMFLCIKSFYKDNREIKFNKKLLLCFAFCLLYSLSDELHQLLTPTRKFALFDLGVDNLGLLFCLLTFFINNRKNKNNKTI